VKSIAGPLRTEKIKVLVVGVGSGTPKDVIQQIASEPMDGYMVDDFDKLSGLAITLSKKTCTGLKIKIQTFLML